VLQQCELDLALDTDEAMVGDVVTASGRPITGEIDTAVRVGSEAAVIVDVDRPQPACEGCDACRVRVQCGVCEECGVCDQFCAECVEIVSFEIPDLAPGDAAVTVVNSYGVSAPLPLTIVADADDAR
jgi:hypothetical protein